MKQASINKMIKCLTAAAHEVSNGNYGLVDTIFELTSEGEYPDEIVAMAEAFGMMIVKIEAAKVYSDRLIEDLQVANLGMVEVLGSAIAKRDSDTNAHNYRVTYYAIHLGKAAGISDDALRSLIKGSFLHDVGKIAISDSILLKPGKLSEDEFEIMKTHVIHGSDIIRSYEWLSDATEIIRHHHEKYSGDGYPDGLKGENIHLNARIFAIVDVFDALTSKRPYKDAVPFKRTMEIMARDSGIHFDPGLFSLFSEIAQDVFDDLNGIGEAELAARMHTLGRAYFGNGHFAAGPLSWTTAENAKTRYVEEILTH